MAGSEENCSGRIGFANFLNGLGEDWINDFGGGRVLWFVQQFERQTGGLILIMSGDLLPKADEFIGLSGGSGGKIIEMMDIDENTQALVESVCDDEIDLFINFRFQSE